MSVINRRRLNQARAAAASVGLSGLDFSGRYDAAGQGRRIKSWNPPSTGPQGAIQGFERIRNRSRDTTRNDWSGQSGAQKWTTTLVGVGIVPRWDADDLNTLWAKHARTCDADGVLDAYGLQALAVRSWFVAGEVFMRRRWRDLSLVSNGYLAVPSQVQLIEADMVPAFDADVWDGMPTGNTIRQGIERNKYGRRVAYWMYREHPGDKTTFSMPDNAKLLRIPAGDVAHMFEPDRPGSLRGVSPLANVLTRMRASADFEDAVLDRQKLANLFVAFLKREMPDTWSDIELDPLTGLPKWYDSRGNPIAGLEPGMFQELQPGESVEFTNPPGAAATFSEYMRTTNTGTAAGLGLPYGLFSGDIENTSDRTLRVLINEFRRYAEQRQWHLVIPMLCQPMVDWWADAAAMSHISPLRLDEMKSPQWNPHGWEYIHPVQDVQGKVLAIEAGLTSQTAEIAKRGDDPRQVFAQRAADQKLAEDLGIAPPPAAAAAVAAQAQHQDTITMQGFQARMHESMMAFGQQLASAVAGRPISVAPTPVQITNEVKQAPVEVTANLVMPDRESVTEIELDADNNLKRTVTTQKTKLQ